MKAQAIFIIILAAERLIMWLADRVREAKRSRQNGLPVDLD